MRTGCKSFKISNKINKKRVILQDIKKPGGRNLCEEGENMKNNMCDASFIREMRVHNKNKN